MTTIELTRNEKSLIQAKRNLRLNMVLARNYRFENRHYINQIHEYAESICDIEGYPNYTFNFHDNYVTSVNFLNGSELKEKITLM